MGVYDDLLAQQTVVDGLQKQLADAQSKLTTLATSAVKGGPDVSQTQGDVNWPSVKSAGYDTCFPKVSDGDVNDPSWSANRVANIRSAGLNFSPYYYARVASAGNGFRTPRTEVSMAYYFASRYGWGKTGDLPLAYDVEQNAGESSTFQGRPLADAAAHIIGFIANYRALTGHFPFLYSNPSTLQALAPSWSADDKALLAQCPLWISHFGVDKPTVPAPWTTWTFWQHTDKALVAGVTGPVDLSRANITTTQLDALRIK